MINYPSLPIIAITGLSIILAFHGLLSLWQMLTGWADINNISQQIMPKNTHSPRSFFTIIIPVRHEENVIGDTLKQFVNQDYPKHLFEILIPVTNDDTSTISEINRIISRNPRLNIRKVLFTNGPINKPHGLNMALKEARGDYIAVFDAEDQIHNELFSRINNLIIKDGRIIFQIGVSLFNWQSNWYCLHASLEYFFWFKSRLAWYQKKGIVPLPGVGVFLPREIIINLGGWNEQCLTEDADLGVICSANNFRFRIITDPDFAVTEEIPHKHMVFIRQRTRWIQGFLQILTSGNWRKLNPKQQFYFLTLFLFPLFQILLNCWLLVSWLFIGNLPLGFALISFLPLAILILQIIVQMSGMTELFYYQKQSRWLPVAWLLYLSTYIFYQLFVSFCVIRAIWRIFIKNFEWEKTIHVNAHRNITKAEVSF